MDLLTRRLTGRAGWPFNSFELSARTWVPAMDVFQRDGNLVVRAELPGIDPEKDVEITLQDGVLTIRGERRQQERTEENGGYRFESRYGSFERSVVLPEGVKEKDISATYEDGILEVVVPGVAELTEAKVIPVQVGSARKAILTRGRKS